MVVVVVEEPENTNTTTAYAEYARMLDPSSGHRGGRSAIRNARKYFEEFLKTPEGFAGSTRCTLVDATHSAVGLFHYRIANGWHGSLEPLPAASEPRHASCPVGATLTASRRGSATWGPATRTLARSSPRNSRSSGSTPNALRSFGSNAASGPRRYD